MRDVLGTTLQPILDQALPATYLVALLALGIEFTVLRAMRTPISRRGGATSLSSGALAFGLLFVVNRLFYLGLMQWVYAHRVTTIGLGGFSWLGCFVLYDLMFYVGHRAGHRIRLLWCFHSVHHTAAEMRLTTAVRGSIFDFVYLPWFFVWLPLLGFHPSMLLIVESGARIWGTLVHVSPRLIGKLGFLDRLLVTPSVHRVHHGKDLPYLDRNYGETLLFWDYLFGSYRREDHAPTYGVVKPIDPDHLSAIQFAPWTELWHDLRRAPTWSARLRYLFDAPGFAHDGPDERVRTRQRAG